MDNFNWISRLSSLEYIDLSGVYLHKEMNWLELLSALPSLNELHLENSIVPTFLVKDVSRLRHICVGHWHFSYLYHKIALEMGVGCMIVQTLQF